MKPGKIKLVGWILYAPRGETLHLKQNRPLRPTNQVTEGDGLS